MNMNKYVKSFLHRGLMFGGFGPIIVGIVYYILSLTIDSFSISGGQLLLVISSSYVLHLYKRESAFLIR